VNYTIKRTAFKKEKLLISNPTLPDRKADTKAAAIISMLSENPGELVKTITCDRGAEFANWQTIEKKLNCDVYFADPYCAWQKGTNENSNGLFREFYPKGRGLSSVCPKILLRNLSLINNRPRKCLNYISAQDSWNAELQNLS